MTPPKGIPQNVWRRVPVAKQRLLLEGPPYSGHDALRMAVIVFAAELCSHDVPEETALALCLEMPFIPGATPERNVRKQIPAFVKWAYSPPDDIPLLTGCPRAATRYGTTDSNRGRLKGIFEPYCDGDCFPCPIFLARGAPELSLVRSKYEPLLLSRIWMPANQGGLSGETRVVWIALAALAQDSGQEVVEASRNYLVHRLGGKIQARTISRRLKRLEEHGLIQTINRQRGWRRILPLTDTALAELEARLGVVEVAKWNRIEANWDSLRKAIDAPKWDIRDEIGVGRVSTKIVRKNS